MYEVRVNGVRIGTAWKGRDSQYRLRWFARLDAPGHEAQGPFAQLADAAGFLRGEVFS